MTLDDFLEFFFAKLRYFKMAADEGKIELHSTFATAGQLKNYLDHTAGGRHVLSSAIGVLRSSWIPIWAERVLSDATAGLATLTPFPAALTKERSSPPRSKAPARRR